MPARIRRLFFAAMLIVTAVLLGQVSEAEAGLESRFVIRRNEVLKARQLSQDMSSHQEFSFTEGDKIIHCRMNSLVQGKGFACEFHLGDRVLMLTSLEMDRIDKKLGSYAAGDRIFLRGRVALECSVARATELDWTCRY